jgi:hypothetical protein
VNRTVEVADDGTRNRGHHRGRRTATIRWRDDGCIGASAGGFRADISAAPAEKHDALLRGSEHRRIEVVGELSHAALRAVQQRHPLLNVYVEDPPQTGLAFYRPAYVPPIPVNAIYAEAERSGRDVVAAELTRPFDTPCAPLMRVVLLGSGPSTPAAIVLTVDHVIADGLSAGNILRDLFAALNDRELQALPVPPSQEELIGALRDGQPAAVRAANDQPQTAQPDWLSTRSTIRPFDRAAPHICTVCFDKDLTGRLVARARAERTTAHSALVSAMTQPCPTGR